jgi:LacI family transcriptional regulator
VSPATVSRVLSSRGDFSSATRARVLAAADLLGYDRERTRVGRPPSGSSTIELVVGQISNNWTNRVFAGVWSRAAPLGLDVTVTRERSVAADDWPERVTGRRSLGVILGPTSPTSSQRAKLRAARLPLVLLGPLVDGADSSSPQVLTTDYRGGFSAGEHLVQQPVVELVVVCGRPSYRFGRAREAGFRDAVNGLAPRVPVRTVLTGWDESGPIPDVTEILRSQPSGAVVGIFACNDHLALRAYESSAGAGRTVGEEALIVGFDDDPHSAQCDPPLTTVRQPIEAMGARAVDVLVAISRNLNVPDGSTRTEMPTELIVRGSTRAGLPSIRVSQGADGV